jgi:hypothetical protein
LHRAKLEQVVTEVKAFEIVPRQLRYKWPQDK